MTAPKMDATPMEEPSQPSTGEVTLADDDLPQAANGTDRRGRAPYLTIGRNAAATATATATRTPERRDRARERSAGSSQTKGRHSGGNIARDR